MFRGYYILLFPICQGVFGLCKHLFPVTEIHSDIRTALYGARGADGPAEKALDLRLRVAAPAKAGRNILWIGFECSTTAHSLRL